jgi:tetratricopeptide (TPR) repeat protein
MKSDYYLLLFAIVAITFFWILNLNPEVQSLVQNSLRSVANKTSPLFQNSTEMRYVEVLKYYDKALAINPNATNILSNKGMVLTKLGKYEEAITVFDKILSLDPNNVAGLYNKGVALGKLGAHTEAEQYLQKASQINPNYTPSIQKGVQGILTPSGNCLLVDNALTLCPD